MIHCFALHKFYEEWLSHFIDDANILALVYNASIVLITIILAFFVFKLGRWLMYRIAHVISRKKGNSILSALKDNKFFSLISYYLPLFVVKKSISLLLPNSPKTILLIENSFQIIAVVLFVLIIHSVLNTFVELNQYKASNRSKPIKGLVQFIQVIIWFFAVIACLSIIFSKSPGTVIGGLGAASAVLMLIFKDSITGLVAGVQLSVNKSIEIGDWIALPKYEADGTVIDITLTSIKVQNWDKTISTIPSYNLVVTDSVKNFKGMQQAEARRIKRSIPIDMLSVFLCTPEKIENYKRIPYVKDALAKVFLSDTNEANEVWHETLPYVDKKDLTNLSLFRIYLYNYLINHEKIHQGMDLMIRQAQPDNYGIPLEIYCFTNTTVWIEYENIQSQIFEHILGVLPYFDLKVFQSPMSVVDMQLEKSSEIIK